jgi:hypothetical protein
MNLCLKLVIGKKKRDMKHYTDEEGHAETRNESTGYLIHLIKSLIMSDMRRTNVDSR